MKKLSFAVAMVLALVLIEAGASSKQAVKQMINTAASAVWGT